MKLLLNIKKSREKLGLTWKIKKIIWKRIKLKINLLNLFKNLFVLKFFTNLTKFNPTGSFVLEEPSKSKKNLFGMHSQFLTVITGYPCNIIRINADDEETDFYTTKESLIGKIYRNKFKKVNYLSLGIQKLPIFISLEQTRVIFIQTTINKTKQKNQSNLREVFKKRFLWQHFSKIAKENKYKKKGKFFYLSQSNSLLFHRPDMVWSILKINLYHLVENSK